ncbi:hypothetical protein BKP43_63830 [Variovorax boronicumulans]|nr:hypothetical protein BKP43_63830 [Variovorax boronicumulans]
MSAAVAWSPSSTEMGSPEAARVSTKTSTATSASTMSMPAKREAMKRNKRVSYLIFTFQKKGQFVGW